MQNSSQFWGASIVSSILVGWAGLAVLWAFYALCFSVFSFFTIGSSEPSRVRGVALDAALFPGGESEGWVVVQAAQAETGLTLVFDPLLDFFGRNKRYLSLER